jgi:hypothetical protein
VMLALALVFFVVLIAALQHDMLAYIRSVSGK